MVTIRQQILPRIEVIALCGWSTRLPELPLQEAFFVPIHNISMNH